MTNVINMPKSPKQICRTRAEALLKEHKEAFAEYLEKGGAEPLMEFNRLNKSYKHAIKLLQRQYPHIVHAGMYYAFEVDTNHLVHSLTMSAAWLIGRKWLMAIGVTVFILSLAAVLWTRF